LPLFPIKIRQLKCNWGTFVRKLLLGMAFTLSMAFVTPAPAMPGTASGLSMQDALANPDLVEVKGGRGGGRGLGRGGGGRVFGWSRGKKVGWRGRGCPPGLWRQGRC
jgi:hypothetical protein